MKAKLADLAYRNRTRGLRLDYRPGRWQHIESRRIVARTKLKLLEEHDLRPYSLDILVAGRIQTSRDWWLALRSLLAEGPDGCFVHKPTQIGTLIFPLATQTPSLMAYAST